MTDLGAQIADCPKRHAAVTERCDVYFPGLPEIMDPDAPPAKGNSDDAADDNKTATQRPDQGPISVVFGALTGCNMAYTP
jgi:hypothetical protein